MLKLVVNPGTEQAWEIPLPQGSTKLGSDPNSLIPISNATVSHLHCEIQVTDDRVVIKDLGSSYGTFVNNALVTEFPVSPGQMIHIGEVAMRLTLDDLFAVTPAPSAPSAPVAAPAVKSGMQNCKFHPYAVARWFCASCNGCYCDLCVGMQKTTTETLHTCRKCGCACTIIEARFEAPPEENFFEVLPSAFVYPFTGFGFIWIVAVTVIVSLVNYLGFMLAVSPGVGFLLYGGTAMLLLSVLGFGYLFNHGKGIVLVSAQGSDEQPDWPDFSDLFEEIILPFLQLVVLVLVSFIPAMAFSVWRHFNDGLGLVGEVVALAAGFLVAPMGILVLAMLDRITALNPVALVWSISRVPKEYFAAAAIFELIVGVYFVSQLLSDVLKKVPVLPGIVFTLISVYLVMVGMRGLGLLFRTNRDRLGWL